jgi:hypothetical protein
MYICSKLYERQFDPPKKTLGKDCVDNLMACASDPINLERNHIMNLLVKE